MQSHAITCNHMQSEAIRGNQRHLVHLLAEQTRRGARVHVRLERLGAQALHRRSERVHILTKSCLQSEHALAHPTVLRTGGPLALRQLLAQGAQIDLVLAECF